MSNSIVIQPVDTITNLGLVTHFHCEGSGGEVYRWQYCIDGYTWVDIDNNTATTNTLSWVPDTYDIQFRCRLIFPDLETLYSNAVDITPGEPPNVGYYNGWYYSERYGGLNTNQRWDNIRKLMRIMVVQWGWTEECSSAICGNIWAESGASPGTWETWPLHGEENTGRGYGFVQWTAARTTIIPYANQYWPMYQWRNNGDIQVQRLKYEYDHNIEWLHYGGWASVHSDKAPADLCEDFVRGYLRPTEEQIQATLGNRMHYTLMIYNDWRQLPLIPILKKLTLEGRKNR